MKTITNNSKAILRYVGSNVQQTIQMVTDAHFRDVKFHFDEYMKLKPKEQAWYAKNNKTKLLFNEVTESSPLGKAIMGLSENQTGIMALPKIQGGQYVVEIIHID